MANFPIEEYLKARAIQDQVQPNPLAQLAQAFAGGVGQGMTKRVESNIRQDEAKQKLYGSLMELQSKGNVLMKKSNPSERANPMDSANYLKTKIYGGDLNNIDVVEIPQTKVTKFYDPTKVIAGQTMETEEGVELKPITKEPKTMLDYDPFGKKYYLGGTNTIVDPNMYPNREIRNMQAPAGTEGRIPPVAMATTYASTQNAIRLLEKAKDLQDKYSLPTGLENPANRRDVFGTLARIPMTDKNRANLIQTMNQYSDAYRKAITGAQAGFPELQYLESSNPSIVKDNPELFQANVNATLDNLKNNLNIMKQTFQKSGYSIPDAINAYTTQQSIPETANISQKTDGKLMIDDNGNKAMVYPDGSYEEVK